MERKEDTHGSQVFVLGEQRGLTVLFLLTHVPKNNRWSLSLPSSNAVHSFNKLGLLRTKEPLTGRWVSHNSQLDMCSKESSSRFPQKTASTWVQMHNLKATNVHFKKPTPFFSIKIQRQPLEVILSYYLPGLFVRTATMTSYPKGYSVE